jgi:hypothetical protein
VPDLKKERSNTTTHYRPTIEKHASHKQKMQKIAVFYLEI